MKKILIIGDLHFGKSRESTTNSDIVRQANTQAKKTFESLVPRFKKIAPDLLVHMGDALRDTFIKNVDSKNLKDAILLVEEVDVPTIHLLGNHELMAFEHSDVAEAYGSFLKDDKFFGVLDLDDIQLVWLDLELDNDGQAFLSKERLEWLKNISLTKTTILFSHYSLKPIDSKGSFYFEDAPDKMHYKNFNDVRKTLDSLNVRFFINAHVHLLTHEKVGDNHFISNPSFSENIAGEKFIDNNPGIYSILEVDESKFIFSSYSGEFCFAKIQGKL